MPRTGRPKTDSPKLRSLSLRVDDAEYEKLKDYAAKHDMLSTFFTINSSNHCTALSANKQAEYTSPHLLADKNWPEA